LKINLLRKEFELYSQNEELFIVENWEFFKAGCWWIETIFGVNANQSAIWLFANDPVNL